ncbi:MAG: biopolymer transporter ExbD [Spirochaetales bacterium]|nr:biopolymer transporter ExbD [Spirochaetales bacterium]
MKKNRKRDQNILLTPLIDVIFLVVIFFMVSSSLSINPSIRVNLPQAQSSSPSVDKEIIVTFTESKDIYIGELLVLKEDFIKELQRELRNRSSKGIFFQGEENIAYKSMVEIMDMAKQAGVQSISLLTRKKIGENGEK